MDYVFWVPWAIEMVIFVLWIVQPIREFARALETTPPGLPGLSREPGLLAEPRPSVNHPHASPIHENPTFSTTNKSGACTKPRCTSWPPSASTCRTRKCCGCWASGGRRSTGTPNSSNCPRKLVHESLARAGKSFTIYGRDRRGGPSSASASATTTPSPARRYWLDDDLQRRFATLEDVRTASRLADALPRITIVGAMSDPHELPVAVPLRRVVAAEQLKNTTKPHHVLVPRSGSARFLLELFTVVAGSEAEAIRLPLAYPFLEPISPSAVSAQRDRPVVRNVPLQPAGADRTDGADRRHGARHAGRHDGPGKRRDPGRHLPSSSRFSPALPVCYGGIPHAFDMRTTQLIFCRPGAGPLWRWA